jgi:iron complex outermembrane recepter protein
MKSILSAVIGATLVLSAIEAGADGTPGARQVSLTIETDTLAAALDKWAQQTGFQIFVQDWEATQNLPAKTLKGTFTAQDALEQLLSGTSLTYMWISDKAVSIRKNTAKTIPTVLQRTSLEGRQATPVAKFSGDDASGALIHVAAAESGSGDNKQELDRQIERVSEIVIVTGTHIHGVRNATVPVTVFDKSYIDSTGLSTSAELIEALPQNFALANQSAVSTVSGVTGAKAQGSSINLRGIGEGTTLVLVNGRRLAPGFVGSAVDISALPLSAVERVEIVTDGASAIYGSDAVGGVVNFILRNDFDGIETGVRTGWAEGDVNEYRVTQMAGKSWSSGNAMASLEYYKRDMLRARDRDFVPAASEIGSLSPRDTNYSAFVSGRQALTDTVSVFTEALYTKRDTFNEAGRVTLHENNASKNSQVAASLGFNWEMQHDWETDLTASYAQNKLDQEQNSDSFAAFGLGSFLFDTHFNIEAAQLKASGPLFELPGGSVRMSIGTDWRSETLQQASVFTALPSGSNSEFDQIVRSAFAEFYVPIIGAANSFRGVNRLHLSIAGRFDEYSTFGSSFDPRFGIAWEPINGLRLRGSYGTSYVAPRLIDYDIGSNFALATLGLDPEGPGGLSQQLQVFGADVGGFSAQESESSSFGIEYVPPDRQDLHVGLNYYNIAYRDRIANPPAVEVVLGNPNSFGNLIIRNPSVEQVAQSIAIGDLGQGFFPFLPDGSLDPNFDPSSIDVIVDVRRRNLSEVKTSGFDASIGCRFATAAGNFDVGLVGTYIIELLQRVTRTSEPFDTVDTFYNPPDWRLRASLGWQRGGWGAHFFVNHTDSYVDNRTTIPVPISSYTTMDMRVAYDFGERSGSGALAGLAVSLNVQNLFDRHPPHTSVVGIDSDMGFDPTNANPMGRFLAIEMTKAW